MTVDCFGFSVGWFGGVGPVSVRLLQIFPSLVSCSGFREAGFEALGLAASGSTAFDSMSFGFRCDG